MNTRRCYLGYRVVVIAILLCGVSGARAAPPTTAIHAPSELGHISALLYSPDSVDALHMTCMPTDHLSTDLAEVNCEFSQLLVTKKGPPPAADVQAYEKELRRVFAESGKLKKELASCPESTKFLVEVRALQTEPHKRASVDRERAALDALCACKTFECVVAAKVAELNAKARNACSVVHTRFERVFKRQSSTRWTSVSGPAGLCGTVLTLVIEYNEAEDSWTYTQKRVVTSAEPTCDGFESTTKSYSHHRYAQSAIMNCETIDSLLP